MQSVPPEEPEPIECHTDQRVYDPEIGTCVPFDGRACPAVVTYGDGPCDEYPAEMEPDPLPCPPGMMRSGESACMSVDEEEEGSTVQPPEDSEELEESDGEDNDDNGSQNGDDGGDENENNDGDGVDEEVGSDKRDDDSGDSDDTPNGER